MHGRDHLFPPNSFFGFLPLESNTYGRHPTLHYHPCYHLPLPYKYFLGHSVLIKPKSYFILFFILGDFLPFQQIHTWFVSAIALVTSSCRYNNSFFELFLKKNLSHIIRIAFFPVASYNIALNWFISAPCLALKIMYYYPLV